MSKNLHLKTPAQIQQKVESHRNRQRIRRLPPLLRDDVNRSKNYDPKVISFGPFHHGKPHLHLGQTFKHKALKSFISATGKGKTFYYNKIVADIDAIRGCYDLVMCDEVYLSDEVFAEMMLLDGCFIVTIMEILLSNSDGLISVLYSIGMAGFSSSIRDMFLLENQVPYRIITLLINLRYDDPNQGLDLLENFLNFIAFQGHFGKPKKIKGGDGTEVSSQPPLHLLEAIRWKLVLKPNSKRESPLKVKMVHTLGKRIYNSRPVTDIRSKGIDVKPSPSACLRDISFTSNSIFSADLYLPTRCISEHTKALFANLIAYEISPDNVNDYTVSSYVNLMKSLVHSARDVKELRVKRVLISNLGSDEEVFEFLKDVSTCGMENTSIFDEVKERIEEHHNSKVKTWMAELGLTYIDNLWTPLALLTAIFHLFFNFLQTFFTIHPRRL